MHVISAGRLSLTTPSVTKVREQLYEEVYCYWIVEARYRGNLRNRSAFAMTETELNVMAALASMGLKRTPTNG